MIDKVIVLIEAVIKLLASLDVAVLFPDHPFYAFFGVLYLENGLELFCVIASRRVVLKEQSLRRVEQIELKLVVYLIAVCNWNGFQIYFDLAESAVTNVVVQQVAVEDASHEDLFPRIQHLVERAKYDG